MADRESERDRRVRELLSSDKSGNSGEQMAVLGQSQAEVQDIQSELQNHIALQRAQEDSRLRETQSITQAATGLMAMQQDDLQGQVATMNPQTQATMGKFGVKPQRSQNTTSNSSSNSSVSRSGNVTNIRNENVTHNTTNIKVTQPQIPVSQPQIPIQQVRRDDGTSKFKAWLSEMFAKQQNEAEIQRKEYRKKEWALGRTTTRLMKRIGEATSNIGNKLDPQVMTSSLGGQLKWLLMIFGATMIAKVWKPTMKFLANLESGFRAVFGLPINQDLRNNTTGTLSIIEQIKSFIGIKKGENTSLIKGIGEVFMQGIDKLIDRLKFWFEDRAKAMRSVEFPKMESSVDFGLLGDVLGPAMEGITDTFRNVAAYLGDLITVAMGGTKGKMKVAARKMSRKAQESFTNTEGKEKSFGDSALINGNGRDYMRKSDYDMMGNLKGDAASTQAMSQSLISMINDKSNTGHAVEIAEGVSQLFKTAENNGGVVINPDILTYLGLTNKDLVTLKGNGMLKEKQYRIIFVKPSETQRIEHYGEKGDGWSTTLGIGGAVAGGFTGGLLWGAPVGFGIGTGIGDQIDESIWRHGQENLYPKLVPAESNEMSEDGSPGIPKVMWELTREGAKQVTHKLTQGMTNTDLDLTNREFYDRIIRLEEQYKRKNGVGGNIIQGISDNELRQQQAAYDAYLRENHDRYESTDPNSYNMQHFYKWNTTYGNVSNLVNQGVSYLSNSMRGMASNIKGESLTPGQELSRQNYLIDRLVQEGLTVEQAAGIAANIRRESNYRTNVAGDRGTSIGIAQWHNERITAYNTKFGAKGPLKDASFPEQVEYLIWEAKQNGTWDAVRSTSSAEEAANMFERKFERSRDYQNEGNATRMRYASEALRSYRTDSSYNQAHITTNYTSQNTSTEPQYQATYFRGESPYEIVPQGGFKVSGSNIVAWIGDSHSQLGLPDTVGKIVKSKLNCEFIWGCKHGFTCNNHLKDDAYSNSSNPSEITKFSDILSKNPSIVIVELGDNDALNSNWQTGVDNLINKIKSIGAKVIWSTPIGYSTKNSKHVENNALNNKFREYILSRSDIMSIDTGGFIGFYSNSPTVWDQYVSNDNIHWNREGYKKLGEWIGGMLTGEAVTNPGYNQADLETQSNGQNGLWGRMTGLLGSSLDYLAGLIDPKSDNYALILESPFENMNQEQKDTFNKMISQMNQNEYMNIKSWERLGAKTDEKGLYFEQPGGVKVYVRTDGAHSGMFGLRKDDIVFVERPDANNPGSYTGEFDTNEWEIYTEAAIGNVNSFFVQYEEKSTGEGYNDYIKDKNGNAVGIKLKTVEDIDSFSKQAQKDFGGKITFMIYPTKDFRRYNMYGIPKRVKFTGYIYGLEELSINTYYGPIIWHKGARWIEPGYKQEDHKYIEYQPICYLSNVKLTPQATLYANEAINFICKCRSSLKDKINNGEISGDGTVTGHENFSFGSSDIASIFAENNQVATQYDDKVFKNEIFSVDTYSKFLNIDNTVEARKKYYQEHKDQFTEIEEKDSEGKVTGTVIYGPQGLIWGTKGANGEINWIDNTGLGNVTREELDENINRINRHNSEVFADKTNTISYDVMADYISRSSALASQGYETGKGNSEEEIRVGTLKLSINNNVIDIPYYYSIAKKYHVRANDLKAASIKNNVEAFKLKAQDFYGNSVKDLRANILNKIKESGYSAKFNSRDGSTGVSRNEIKDYDNVDTTVGNSVSVASQEDASSIYQQLVDEFVSYGKKVTHIQNNGEKRVHWYSLHPYIGLVFYLEGGDTKYKRFYRNDVTDGQYKYLQVIDTNKLKNDINKIIDSIRKKNKPTDEALDEAFKPVGEAYQRLADKANKGEMTYKTLDGGYVMNEMGQVFGREETDENGKKKVVALGRQEAEQHLIDTFNTDSMRSIYYKAVLGDNLRKENGEFYYVLGDKKVRLNLNTDLNVFKQQGLGALIRSDAEVYQQDASGNWSKLDSKSAGYTSTIDNFKKTFADTLKNLNNNLNAKVWEEYRNKLLEAQNDQWDKEVDKIDEQIRNQGRMIHLLKIIAKEKDEDSYNELESELVFGNAESTGKATAQALVEAHNAGIINLEDAERMVSTKDGKEWIFDADTFIGKKKGDKGTIEGAVFDPSTGKRIYGNLDYEINDNGQPVISAPGMGSIYIGNLSTFAGKNDALKGLKTMAGIQEK